MYVAKVLCQLLIRHCPDFVTVGQGERGVPTFLRLWASFRNNAPDLHWTIRPGAFSLRHFTSTHFAFPFCDYCSSARNVGSFHNFSSPFFFRRQRRRGWAKTGRNKMIDRPPYLIGKQQIVNFDPQPLYTFPHLLLRRGVHRAAVFAAEAGKRCPTVRAVSPFHRRPHP